VNGALGEIELGFHRAPETYDVEIRVCDPGSESEIAPVRGHARISLEDLGSTWNDSNQYAKLLTEQTFQDTAIRELYGKIKAAFDARGLMLRLRLLIGPSAPELHSLRWELLLDPENKQPLATSERILFSRLMVSRDWRVVKLRPKARLNALIAVAAPEDAEARGLALVDAAGEITRARESLGSIESEAIGSPDEPLTLTRLMDSLRTGTDILYLACHGAIPKGKEPYVVLQNDDGNALPVTASNLAGRIAELQEAPRLIVLASCESAGDADAQSALAPRLADAGVPAVVAMQGKISMETVKQSMPVFFRELAVDGQIDRAMAVARGNVRERRDSWMPALFLRLKNGRIWYEPGFGGERTNEFEKWKSICSQIRKGHFIPILGPELAEDVFGGTRELANRLAEKHAFPLAAYERMDLAKVTQYISTNQDRTYVQDAVLNQFRQQLSERLAGVNNGDGKSLPDLATEYCRKNPSHPFSILPELNASIYLTASCETMLLRSLKAAGKDPEAVVASWRGVNVPKRPHPKFEEPTPQKPWVYHIFGRFGMPDSLVLTEDDFFDYLIATSRLDLLPPRLTGPLMQSSLLFLGFRLDDWRFRVLFRMIVTRSGTETMKNLSHVGVQVNPDEHDLADVERARRYMERYFRGKDTPAEISIYWGSVTEFLNELRQHLAEMGPETVVAARAGQDDWL
jgi:hypothetical protein